MSNYELRLGDCLEVLKEYPDNYFDSVVADPPYEISFMSKKWDNSGIAFKPETWAAVLRVLKPGAHLLAFGGTRTSHRMVCAIEDAGFEIRDTISWIYGSGMPKSLCVSKAIDKAAGIEREVIGKFKISGQALGKTKGLGKITPNQEFRTEWDITAPATDAAKQWSGWGSALKPAQELICLARKPLSEPTIAANVLKWGGCGGLNIDASRIGTEERTYRSTEVAGGGRERAINLVDRGDGKTPDGRDLAMALERQRAYKENQYDITVTGRWPSNVIIDDSPEVLAEFAKFGESKSSGHLRHNGAHPPSAAKGQEYAHTTSGVIDSGTPARYFKCCSQDDATLDSTRFFYSAKASKRERGEGNNHPCVKPLALLRYLITLISPPGGIVLDPFMGSGSTLVACVELGFNCVGIEMDEHYLDICRQRIEQAQPALLKGAS